MKNPDFARSLLVWIHENQKAGKPIEPFVLQAAPLLRKAVKFSLPKNGLIPDEELDPPTEDGIWYFTPSKYQNLMNTSKMHLPYELLVLELEHEAYEHGEERREVILCQETEQDCIMTVFAFKTRTKTWHGLEPLPINRERVRSDEIDTRYQPALCQVLALLNCLSCSNVRVQEQPVSPVKKAMGKIIPFDSYRTLVFDPNREPGEGSGGGSAGGTGMHYREHVRRGHYCTTAKGTRYWKNSTVVNEGKGYAKITKNYRVKV